MGSAATLALLNSVTEYMTIKGKAAKTLPDNPKPFSSTVARIAGIEASGRQPVVALFNLRGA
jgi:hypothetical protein